MTEPLTRRGQNAIVVAVVASVMGHLLGYAELLVLATGVAAALVFGAASVVRPEQLHVRRTLLGATEVGAPVRVAVEVENRSPRRSPAVELDDGLYRRSLPQVAPGEPVVLADQVGHFTRRGVVEVAAAAVVRGDRLGLWHRTRVALPPQEVWVRPRVYELGLLDATHTTGLEQADTDALVTSGVEFKGVRDYVPGEDARRIHWRTSARLDAPMVREDCDSALVGITVALDVRADQYQDEAAFEEAVSAAASVVFAAGLERRAQALVTTAGDDVGSALGSADALIDFLTEVSLADQSINAAPEALRAIGHRGGVLIAIGGSLDAADLSTASQTFAPTAAIVIQSNLRGAFVDQQGRWLTVWAPSAESFAKAWDEALHRP